MEKSSDAAEEQKTIVVRLVQSDFEILERFRGEMTPEAFISVLLRMIDSGAVVTKPQWVKEAESK